MGWKCLLLLAALLLDGVISQFGGGQAFFGNFQSAQPSMGQSQVSSPSWSSPSMSSPNMSSSSLAGSVHKSKTSSFSADSSDTGSRHRIKKRDDSSSNFGGSDSSEGSGEDSGSGSWDMGSGSSSSSMEYECDCRSIRRVSLMGASDYCLSPNASLSSKCGNIDLAEGGACPMTGAMPCSSKGHILANDSLCALDDKDDTYKCVASKKDLEIQKHGKKKKKKNKSGRHNGSDSKTSTASTHLMLTARQVLAIVICVAAGVMAVV